MAFTLNGIGTRYYGHRIVPEGMVVMTKWFVVLYALLIPLGTFEILEWGDTTGSFLQTTPYRVKPVRTDYLHIGSVYLLYGAAILGIAALNWLLR